MNKINNVSVNDSPKQTHRQSSKYILAAIAAIIFLLIVWGICIVLNSFITVKEIVINGECIYSHEQIIAASGIEKGMKKNKIDVDKVEQNILGAMSFISDVNVNIKINGNAVFNITAEEISYNTCIADQFYVMSDSYRILGVSSEARGGSEAIFLELPRVKKALIGSEVEFYENTEYIDIFLQNLNDSFLYDGISSIDLADRYNLTVEYNDRYSIDFGDSKNMDKKIDKVRLLMNSAVIQDMSKALIDVSDISNPTIKPIK